MALKARREREAKLHDELYENIYLITLVYPPAENEFHKVFKSDMFVKNNKSAFQHVVYYLLSVLDRNTLKQRVPSWPPLDPRMESQFRHEIMRYINDLNALYEDANIPTVMISHLVSPGGYKFARFVLKLSHLVLRVTLQGDPVICDDLLHPLKPNKMSLLTKLSITNLKLKTEQINSDTHKVKSECEEYVSNAFLEAADITQDIAISQNNLVDLKEELADRKFSIEKEDASDKKLKDLHTKLECITVIVEKCCEVKKQLTYILQGETVLSYNADDIISVEHCFKNGENIDLIRFFKAVNVYLKTVPIKTPHVTSTFLNSALDMYSRINDILIDFNKKYQDILEELLKLSSVIDNNFSDNTNKLNNTSSSDSEVLAVPLEFTLVEQKCF